MAFRCFVIAVGALAVQASAQTCATINPANAPTWGSGFSGRVVMNGLKSPRGLVFDSAGNLLVVESSNGGVRWIKLTDNGGTDVCVGSSKQLISDRSVCYSFSRTSDRAKSSSDLRLHSSITASIFPQMVKLSSYRR